MWRNMETNKLIWLNTKDDILTEIGDAVLGLQESGSYTDAYIREYLDEYVGRKCDVAFIGFDEMEEQEARKDMFGVIHMFFGM